MEYYIADDTFMPIIVLDNYVSMIWTERYVGPGEFTLTTDNYEQIVKFFGYTSSAYIRKDGSSQIMMIETITKNAGQASATITGRTLDAFFENRNAVSYGSPGPGKYTGSNINIINSIVNQYCCSAGVNKIPGLTSTSWDTSDPSVTLSVPYDTILNMITSVAQGANLGFSIQVSGPNALIFSAYNGNDYSNPSDSPYVELSPNTEFLKNTSAVISNANYKSEARVIGAKTVISVYANGDSAVTGWNRRTIVVSATDVGTDSTTTVAQDQAVLRLRGMAALADVSNSFAQSVDGTVAGFIQADDGTYVQLPTNVYLGDVVAVSDNDLVPPVPARITEMVYSKDNTGELITPTLTMLQSSS